MIEPASKLNFRLLSDFQKLFEGHVYKHRASNQGDYIAMQLYEDLVAIDRSPKLIAAIKSGILVLNVSNRLQGIRARRGDGTFGEIVSGETPIWDEGYSVGRGKIATVEIGVEVKILAKAMIKQIDRVTNDLRNQVAQFRRGNANAVCVGIVGINQADHYVSFEGDRSCLLRVRAAICTQSRKPPRPEKRLLDHASALYNEFLVLRYRATNEEPYPFEWANLDETRLDYGAVLTRISSAFQRAI